MAIPENKYNEIMDSIGNRIRHAYNAGFEAGRADAAQRFQSDIADKVAGVLARSLGETGQDLVTLAEFENRENELLEQIEKLRAELEKAKALPKDKPVELKNVGGEWRFFPADPEV